MSLNYIPINGFAGKIKARLYDLVNDTVSNDIQLLVFGYTETDEESPLNNEFNNIQGDFIQDHLGWHKKLDFDLVNGAISTGGILNESNIMGIIEMSQWINLIKQYPDNYRLEIDYRLGNNGITSTMTNAQFVGDWSLSEISGKSNTGQVIHLQFRNKSPHQIDASASNFLNIMVDNDHTAEAMKLMVDDSSSPGEHYIVLIN